VNQYKNHYNSKLLIDKLKLSTSNINESIIDDLEDLETSKFISLNDFIVNIKLLKLAIKFGEEYLKT